MNLVLNKSYFLKVKVFGRELEYLGKVIFLDSKEFKINTSEDCSLSFQLKDLIYFKEIELAKEEKTFVMRKKGPLKEGHKPVGL